MSLLYIPKQTNMLFVHSAVCFQDKCVLLLFIITQILLSLLLSDFIFHLSLSLPLSPIQSSCFDINVTMTPPFLIRRTVPSYNGFWEHEPATAASDMPDFPPQSRFSYTLPFFPSNFFLHLDLLFFFLLPSLYPRCSSSICF